MEKVDRRKKEVREIEKMFPGKTVGYSETNDQGTSFFDLKQKLIVVADASKSPDDGMLIVRDSEGLATGVLVPRAHPVPLHYLNEAREYNDPITDTKKIIELSNKLYMWEGVISTVVDVMCEFAATDFRIVNIKSPKAQKIVDFFVANVNRDNNVSIPGIQALLREIMLDWFVSGNAFPYQQWDFVADRSISVGNKVFLPMAIYLLNPKNIVIPDGYVEFGSKLLYLKLSTKMEAALSPRASKEDPEITTLRKMFPKELRKKITDDGMVLLNNKLVNHLMRKNRGYMAWGIPYLAKCFSAIAFKRKLKALDEVTTDGLINQITIFKIGDDKNNKTWDPARIRAFARLIAAPTPSMTLVWSYDVDVLSVSPSENIVNFKDKYVQANIDILNALGIPTVLIAGTGGASNTGDAYVQILSLLERLEEPRDIIRTYVNQILRTIMIQNGFKDESPEFEWQNMRLRNEKEVKNLVLSFYDRGLLSIETTLNEAGYDFNRETAIRKDENKVNLENIYQRRDLPFGTPKTGAPGAPSAKSPLPKTSVKTFNKDANNNPNNKSAALWEWFINEFFAKAASDLIDAKDKDDVVLILMPWMQKAENYINIFSDLARDNFEVMQDFKQKQLELIDNIGDKLEDIFSENNMSLGGKEESIVEVLDEPKSKLLTIGIDLIFQNQEENIETEEETEGKENTKPGKLESYQTRYNRCVEQLKADGKSESEAHAICTTSIPKFEGLQRRNLRKYNGKWQKGEKTEKELDDN